MRLKSTLLTPTGFGNGLWGAASRRVVRNAFSVAAMFAIAALGPARMTSVAWADEDSPEEETVSSVSINALGWDFTPVIQNNVIKGIFAQITTDILVEGNLETIWFEQNEAGNWLASSWSGSGTAPNALGWIRGHFEDLSIFNATPSLQEQAPELIFDEGTQELLAGNWSAPTALDGGLLESDPLQLLLGDVPRTPEMFAMMSLNGWPVAPELSSLCSHHGGDCETNNEEITLQQLLNALAAKIQFTMPETTIVGEMDPSAIGVISMSCWCQINYNGPIICSYKKTSESPIIGGGKHYWFDIVCRQRWDQWGEYWYTNCGDCGDQGWKEVSRIRGALQVDTQPGEPEPQPIP